jgi:hypothetical protein
MALKDWQNIFNAISDCVLILDLEGYILQSNGVFESIMELNSELNLKGIINHMKVCIMTICFNTFFACRGDAQVA